MHDGMPYGRNQGQGHSREVDRQSPTGLIFYYVVQIKREVKGDIFGCMVYCIWTWYIFFINDSYLVQLSLLVNVTKVVYKITQQFHVGYI